MALLRTKQSHRKLWFLMKSQHQQRVLKASCPNVREVFMAARHLDNFTTKRIRYPKRIASRKRQRGREKKRYALTGGNVSRAFDSRARCPLGWQSNHIASVCVWDVGVAFWEFLYLCALQRMRRARCEYKGLAPNGVAGGTSNAVYIP